MLGLKNVERDKDNNEVQILCESEKTEFES